MIVSSSRRCARAFPSSTGACKSLEGVIAESPCESPIFGWNWSPTLKRRTGAAHNLGRRRLQAVDDFFWLSALSALTFSHTTRIGAADIRPRRSLQHNNITHQQVRCLVPANCRRRSFPDPTLYTASQEYICRLSQFDSNLHTVAAAHLRTARRVH